MAATSCPGTSATLESAGSQFCYHKNDRSDSRLLSPPSSFKGFRSCPLPYPTPPAGPAPRCPNTDHPSVFRLEFPSRGFHIRSTTSNRNYTQGSLGRQVGRAVRTLPFIVEYPKIPSWNEEHLLHLTFYSSMSLSNVFQ